MAYAGRPILYHKKHGIERFMLGSGAVADMIPKSLVPDHLDHKLRTSTSTMEHHTCNGEAVSDQLIDLKVSSVSLGISPWVRKATPPIMSMGIRCM